MKAKTTKQDLAQLNKINKSAFSLITSATIAILILIYFWL